jgi:hypothetical protein
MDSQIAQPKQSSVNLRQSEERSGATRKWPCLILIAVLDLLPVANCQVATAPVGYIRISLAAGTVSQPAYTAFCVPLTDTAQPSSGVRAGLVDSVTSTSITCRDGGWTPGMLADPSSPWILKIASGAQAGKHIEIAGNSANTITVSGVDVFSLQLIPGQDRFELVPVDTLEALFEGAGLLAGSSADQADVVYLMSAGAWIGYYFNQPQGQWRRAYSASPLNRGQTRIAPDTGIMIARRGPALSLAFLGRVSNTPFRAKILPGVSNLLHTGFPVDISLGQLALHSRIVGWRSGLLDQIYVFSGGNWNSFYHNGSNWTNTAASNQDGVILPAGAPFQLLRSGTPVGSPEMVVPTPAGL